MKKIVSFFLIFTLFLTTSKFTISEARCQDPTAAFLSAAGIVYQAYIQWKEGEARKYYEFSGNLVEEATIRAMKELKLPVSPNVKPLIAPQKQTFKNFLPDVKFGDYTISGGHFDRFKIKITQVEPDITRLTIRVNTMGDKPYAELLYKHVDEQLSIIDFTQAHRKLK